MFNRIKEFGSISKFKKSIFSLLHFRKVKDLKRYSLKIS